jgi:amino acid transporter
MYQYGSDGGLFAALFIGWLISLAIIALAAVLMAWVARGVQAALNIDSTPGIVLAVLLPWVWIIWMSMASNNTRYTLSNAQHLAPTFPLQWFQPNPQNPANAFQ